MFIDKVKIEITSGSGGNGLVAWRKEKFVPKGGPAGGDGGKGGNVYITASASLSTLLDYKYKSKFAAENGGGGGQKNMHGKNGEDITISVPLGTIIRDIDNNKIIGDLTEDGQTLLLAAGGRGGRGNSQFTTSTRRSPQFCEPGEPSVIRNIELELKLIADVGILGLPNAGKSTLISVISAAKPKIADYPFTTLTPNLGVVRKPSGDGFVVADIPGLIEGASSGIGLGHEFLRHVERTRFLIHVLDLTLEDPINNYHIINKELSNYGGRLAEIPQIIALNKIDAVDEEKIEKIKSYFSKESKEVFLISAATKQGIQELLNYVILKVEEIPQPAQIIEIDEDLYAKPQDDSDYTVTRYKNIFVVEGGRVERLVSVTDLKNNEATFRFQNILKSMGVNKALEDAGIQDGDTVAIGSFEFEYYSDQLKEENEDEG